MAAPLASVDGARCAPEPHRPAPHEVKLATCGSVGKADACIRIEQAAAELHSGQAHAHQQFADQVAGPWKSWHGSQDE